MEGLSRTEIIKQTPNLRPGSFGLLAAKAGVFVVGTRKNKKCQHITENIYPLDSVERIKKVMDGKKLWPSNRAQPGGENLRANLDKGSAAHSGPGNRVTKKPGGKMLTFTMDGTIREAKQPDGEKLSGEKRIMWQILSNAWKNGGHGWITSVDIPNRYSGPWRYTDTIMKLRRAGFKIEKRLVQGKNYCQYRLI
jgi:hypothetical protein